MKSSSGDRQAKVLRLIGQVYDAALDERLWSGTAAAFAQAFESPSIAVQLRLPQSSATQILTRTGNIDAEMDRAYCEYHYKDDVWYQRAAQFGIGAIVLSKDLIADSELERTQFFHDWCRRVDQFYIMGSVFPIDSHSFGAVGVHRPKSGTTYDEEDRATAALFLPHLQRALQIRQRLAEPEIAKGLALDVLDRSATAALVVGRDARILYANREAERLLRSGDDLAAIRGRLALRRRAPADRLTALLRGVVDTAAGTGTASGGAMAIERDEHLPLTVLVAPWRPARDGLGGVLPAAIVFIRDPERPTPISSLLQGLFGLTPAEASIAAMLSEGGSIDEIAARQRITRNTARVHLKSIFAKTGTTRQAQLVALILRSVAGVVAV